jgi:hypothetical protein
MYQFFVNTKDVVEEHATFFGALQGPSAMNRFSGWFYRFLQSFLGPVITPITTTIDKTVDAYEDTLDIGKKALQTADTALKTASNIAGKVSTLVSASPVTDLLFSEIKKPALEAPIKGGNLSADLNQLTETANKANKSLNLLPYTLVATILLVITTGFYKNYSKTNAKKDDAPPNPSGVSSTPAQSTATKAT